MARQEVRQLRHSLRWAMILFGVLILIGSISWAILNKPRPQSVSGPAAEVLAHEMLKAINVDAWHRTGAVRFTFAHHHHLWDRKRNYEELRAGKQYVLLDLTTQTGRAWDDGSELHGEDLRNALRSAYGAWVNDSFWLNPIAKIYDAGVRRGIVPTKSQPALLVEYSSGGLTPGDAYLWMFERGNALPVKWQMWVRVMPVGGFPVSWENWITLSTGAKVSTLHYLGPIPLELHDVAGASTLTQLTNNQTDPFTSIAKQ